MDRDTRIIGHSGRKGAATENSGLLLSKRKTVVAVRAGEHPDSEQAFPVGASIEGDRVEIPSPPFELTRETEPDPATARAISTGLDEYNNSVVPGGDWKPLWIVGRDGAGTVQAGIRGTTEFDWLFVNWLWVAEPYRRQGVGSRLLLGAEAIAREHRCSSCYLDTFSFQAPEFYKRHGYQEFGRLEGFPPGHARIWLSKAL